MGGRGFSDSHHQSAGDLSSLAWGGNRTLENPQERWLNDHGSADPNVMQALQRADSSLVVQALRDSRVLVALAKSSANELLPDGNLDEKTSDMSIVCLTACDGRVGLLAFTSVESMKLWNPDARPIPISGRDVSIAALEESVSALIIDPAGPIPFTLTLPDVVELSGDDQRWRAVAPIQELLQTFGIESPVITMPEAGPLVIGVASDSVERVAEVLATRGDIHAFTPQGIAIEISNSGR